MSMELLPYASDIFFIFFKIQVPFSIKQFLKKILGLLDLKKLLAPSTIGVVSWLLLFFYFNGDVGA